MASSLGINPGGDNLLFSVTCKCEPIGLIRRINRFDRFAQTFPVFGFVWGGSLESEFLLCFLLTPAFRRFWILFSFTDA